MYFLPFPKALFSCPRLILGRCTDFDAPQVAITELVLALGPHLTNSDDAIRIRACELLAEVLTKCTKLLLPSHAAKHLIEFFSERLQDVMYDFTLRHNTY
jgi:hypothetical protein